MIMINLELKYLTERVKSPGFPFEGLAKKLPCKPRSFKRCSASTPCMFG